MSIVRVSIFQKYLPDGLNLSILKKLSAVKSDFLLLPEYFYADENMKNPQQLLDRSQFALDWLSKLSDAYRGVVIGGSVVIEEDGKLFNACPVLYEGSIVDYYRKRNLTDQEAAHMSAGQEPGVFMLAGHRFGVLICADILKPELLKELSELDVRMVFSVFNSPKRQETDEDKNERDESLFVQPAKDFNLAIAKCCSTGSIFGNPLQGRSLIATPGGISWRVSPPEEDREILKTVIMNVPV